MLGPAWALPLLIQVSEPTWSETRTRITALHNSIFCGLSCHLSSHWKLLLFKCIIFLMAYPTFLCLKGHSVGLCPVAPDANTLNMAAMSTSLPVPGFLQALWLLIKCEADCPELWLTWRGWETHSSAALLCCQRNLHASAERKDSPYCTCTTPGSSPPPL